MNDHTNGACSCTAEWPEIEARYRRAREAMLQAQQQNCKATYEFLAARAEVRQLLEVVFPEPEMRTRYAELDPEQTSRVESC